MLYRLTATWHSPNFASDFSTAQPPAYLQSVGCGVCGVGFGA